MRTYLYTANDERGRPITKQVRAKDRQEAMDQLRDRGYTHIKLRDVTAATYADASATLIAPGVPDEDVNYADVPSIAELLSTGDNGEVQPASAEMAEAAAVAAEDEATMLPAEAAPPQPSLPPLNPPSDRPPWAYPETINFLRVLPTSPPPSGS